MILPFPLFPVFLFLSFVTSNSTDNGIFADAQVNAECVSSSSSASSVVVIRVATVCTVCMDSTLPDLHHVHDEHYWCLECIGRAFQVNEGLNMGSDFDPLQCCQEQYLSSRHLFLHHHTNESEALSDLNQKRSRLHLPLISDTSEARKVVHNEDMFGRTDWRSIKLTDIFDDLVLFHTTLDFFISVCPNCHSLYHRDDGCDMVKCTFCRKTFCFACGEKGPTRHYCSYRISIASITFGITDTDAFFRKFLILDREPSFFMKRWILDRLKLLFAFERVYAVRSDYGDLNETDLKRIHWKQVKQTFEFVCKILESRRGHWNRLVLNAAKPMLKDDLSAILSILMMKGSESEQRLVHNIYLLTLYSFSSLLKSIFVILYNYNAPMFSIGILVFEVLLVWLFLFKGVITYRMIYRSVAKLDDSLVNSLRSPVIPSSEDIPLVEAQIRRITSLIDEYDLQNGDNLSLKVTNFGLLMMIRNRFMNGLIETKLMMLSIYWLIAQIFFFTFWIAPIVFRSTPSIK